MIEWGNPCADLGPDLDGERMGYSHPSGTGQNGVPSPEIGYAWTDYGVGSTPLAVSAGELS